MIDPVMRNGVIMPVKQADKEESLDIAKWRESPKEFVKMFFNDEITHWQILAIDTILSKPLRHSNLRHMIANPREVQEELESYSTEK